MIQILFVCYGNICRSPMAEAVFQNMVEEAGLSDEITADSAGTSAINIGQPAHRGTREVLDRHGISYRGSAHQVALDDLYQADYVIVMDADNAFSLKAMVPRGTLDGKLHMLLDFAPLALPREVPDPIYDGRFQYVYDLIEAGCHGLLEHVRARHGL